MTISSASATKLTVEVPASLIATSGSANITVTTSYGTSAAATFAIVPPPPTITSLSPTSVTAGGSAFTLTINGTNFHPGSQTNIVTWENSVQNGGDLTATYVSATKLTVVVPASRFWMLPISG